MRQLRRLEPAIVQEVQATPEQAVYLGEVSIVRLLSAWEIYVKHPDNQSAANVRNWANRLRCLGKVTERDCREIMIKLCTWA